MKIYDALIIGAGQAGVPLAKKLAQSGKKTLLIEKRILGGTCVNDGCTPTKTLIASGRIAYLARHSKEWGVNKDSVSIDMPFIKRRKDSIILGSRQGLEKGVEDTEELDLLYGEAVFTGFKTVTVQGRDGKSQEIKAEYIFINTGAAPVIPEIEGLSTIHYFTSTSILDLEQVPEHLLIVGAGYIALEFAQLYRRLGSKVTILERSNTFLAKEDEDVAAELRKILEEEGIQIELNAEVSQVKPSKEGKIIATLKIGNQSNEIACSHLLLASGRKPQSESLSLKKTGVTTDEKGYIEVNDRLETNVSGIYALGDVKGGPAFTHISYNDYVIVSKNLLDDANLTTRDRLIPYCIFTDPQLGRVGLSEKQAREKGYDIKVAKLPMEHVARARETGETRGFMKAVVDEKTKQILGAAIIGVDGGEIVSVLQVAMMGKLTYEQIRDGVFAHPTFSESLNNLFMSLD
ncbi:mercuric reductase [Cytophagaceae bacterium DM2B3-1]|uniref:Mercuric reductase n=1 Tax=Xanthocytophaga flava TaxID=3048013 RepID=A0ABT7CNK6_9BACT|nr:mercuric reductase [Xanthocytophaga flavus]MDJ1495329.1 mercuric reductase [Xanthocytophaga flavus]